MPRGNPDKLIPQNKRTKSEQSEIARRGGIASGEARRKKKLMSQIYADLLSEQYQVNLNGESKKISGADLIQAIARDVLMRRDGSSVSMMREIREATEGQKTRLDLMSEMSLTITRIPVDVHDSTDE